jgi:zinc D-Ala-D-Ala carboxypeptidase
MDHQSLPLAASMNWADYPNFEPQEFECKHCGAVEMQPGFLVKLQALRTEYGKPMRINSGYRCPQHPIEAKKPKPGAHASGRAADISVRGMEAFRVVELAFKHGFTGIGVQQKGDGRFIHLDDSPTESRPMIWSY